MTDSGDPIAGRQQRDADDRPRPPATIDELGRDGSWLALGHWPVFSPERHAKLETEGRLVEVADETDSLIEARTNDVYADLVKAGWTPDAAIVEGRAVALREIVYDRDETDGERPRRRRPIGQVAGRDPVEEFRDDYEVGKLVWESAVARVTGQDPESPMRKVYENPAYEYVDQFDETLKCGLRVYSDDVIRVVVASCLDGTPGRDLQSTRERLIPAVLVGLKLPVYLLVWIEHYSDVSTHHMETPEDPDRFNIVKFDLREDGRIRAFETAQSLSAADVSRLVGEILPTRTEL